MSNAVPKSPQRSGPNILATIVATIGPASESPEMIRRLIEGGVGVFRFNFSHGDFAAHERRLSTVRSVAAGMECTVACLGDLQGPKIRVGVVPEGVGAASPSGGGMIEVAQGQDVVFKAGIDKAFVRQGSHGPEAVLPVTYEELIGEVQPGHRVLINDGLIRMLAVDSDSKARELRARVISGGFISSKKGINLPDSHIGAPAITEKDWECAQWAVRHDLDYLALSFVRRAEDVLELKQRLSKLPVPSAAGLKVPPGGPAHLTGAWIPVVAKIEKPQAVERLDAIVAASDAVMVARGDLGVEMDIARVPVVQKQIIGCCASHGKPCIVATQMLESMIENTTPTRAEASDVANAIFDGADAVMLSAETATGKQPALVVETMARIVAVAEERLREQERPDSPPTQLIPAHLGTAALAHGAWAIAHDLKAKVVACWSQNGGTARYLSQNRFNIPIIAYSSSSQATRRMALLRGVTPVLSEPPASGRLADWNAAVDRYIQAHGLAARGDALVLLAGRPLGQAKATNTIAICRVGESAAYGGA